MRADQRSLLTTCPLIPARTPDDKDIEGKEHATPIKPVDNFFSRWQSIEEKIVAAKLGFSLVIVGGGAGGVELSLCLRHRIVQRDADAGPGAHDYGGE